MLIARSLSLSTLVAVAALAGARPPVGTFSKNDAAQAYGQGCGVAPKGKVRVHRSPDGSMVMLIAEKQGEAVLFAQDQRCNPLQDDVVDLWRRDDGSVAAMLIDRGDGLRLMIDEHAELRGKRFDVERTGQYLVISHGATSLLSAVEKPYLKMAEINLDAHRLFPRKGALLVVGDNPATGQLEGRTLRVTPTGLVEDPAPISMAGLTAGVRVLDFAEDTDDLLVAGLDASGQPSFIVVNLTSGRTASVQPQKPGDDMALFLKSQGVRQRLTGTPEAAQGGATAGARPEGGSGRDAKGEKRGWLKF